MSVNTIGKDALHRMSGKNLMKGIGNVASALGVATILTQLAEPAIDILHDYIEETINDRKRLVTVPKLCSKTFPLSVEQAEVSLESCGLKATIIKTPLTEAHIKYRDCFDSQVISSHPREGQKVEQGTVVLLKTISQDVIDESQHLFELALKRKEERDNDRRARLLNAKERASKTINSVQNALEKHE